MKLGYHYLISLECFYLFTILVLLVALRAQIETLSNQELWIQLWNNLEVRRLGIVAYSGPNKKRRTFSRKLKLWRIEDSSTSESTVLYSASCSPLSFLASSDPCF